MGELTRKGESRPATEDDLALYARAQSTQVLQEVPVLQRAGNPHEYLFFALFDGTGQDVNNPEQLPTNIGVLKGQLDKLDDNPNNRIGYKYVEGIGTQTNSFTRGWDGALPYTWATRSKKRIGRLPSKLESGNSKIPRRRSASPRSATAAAQCRQQVWRGWWTSTASPILRA